jgi:hypothetical protein
MARIRSVKPEFWLDRKLARCVSRDARLLYIGMWNYADEHARLHGDPAVIKGQVFPYDDVAIEPLLAELEALGRVVAYTFDGDPYLHIPTLNKHQRLEPHKTPSRLPSPTDADPSSQVTAFSEKIPEQSEKIPDESVQIVVQQVASGRWQVAGGKEQVAGGMLPEQGKTPSPTANGSAPTGESLIQRAGRLTKAYTDDEPMSNFVAIRGIVKKAMAADYSDAEIIPALERLARDGRGVTTETLRVELQGLPTPRGQPKGSTTDERVMAGLALAAKYEKQEQEEEWNAQKQLKS